MNTTLQSIIAEAKRAQAQRETEAQQQQLQERLEALATFEVDLKCDFSESLIEALDVRLEYTHGSRLPVQAQFSVGGVSFMMNKERLDSSDGIEAWCLYRAWRHTPVAIIPARGIDPQERVHMLALAIDSEVG